jgi:hypothetical protein
MTEGALVPHTQSTVRVTDIPAIIADPDRGVISLVGDHGGLSLITGDVEDSGLVFGTLAFETEHGTVYLDPDAETTISEETPYEDQHEWLVSWTIDGYGSTPQEAAARTGRHQFGRTTAGPDDACVFQVTDSETKETVTVDLNELDLDRIS